MTYEYEFMAVALGLLGKPQVDYHQAVNARAAGRQPGRWPRGLAAQSNSTC